MKRILLACVVVVALAGIPLLAQAVSTQGEAETSGITVKDIRYDGYCDGAHLVINMDNGVTTGNETGCLTKPLLGVYGSVKGNGGVSYVSAIDTNNLWLYMVRADRTWSCFNNGVLFNSGTWSYGTPAAGAEAKSTTQQ